MKSAMTVLAVAALCLCAWAAENAAVGAMPTANHLSPTVSLQSPAAGQQSLAAITIPQMLSYQGKLTDTLGQPVADTLYAVRFRLYAQLTGGRSSGRKISKSEPRAGCSACCWVR